MSVKRIVANISTQQIDKAKSFYGDILGLEIVMDMGWIVTFASEHSALAQMSFMSQGGSGTPVPDLSIEVDNLDEILGKIRAKGLAIEYGPVIEPWRVRRFFVRDPFGKLVNILVHR